MKITISFEVEGAPEAREILRAVEGITKVPYRLDGFGASVLKGSPAPTAIVTEETESGSDWSLSPSGPRDKRADKAAGAVVTKLRGPETAAGINEHILERGPSEIHKTEATLAMLCDRGHLEYNGTQYRKKVLDK